jgi:hypothetical protein
MFFCLIVVQSDESGNSSPDCDGEHLPVAMLLAHPNIVLAPSRLADDAFDAARRLPGFTMLCLEQSITMTRGKREVGVFLSHVPSFLPRLACSRPASRQHRPASVYSSYLHICQSVSSLTPPSTWSSNMACSAYCSSAHRQNHRSCLRLGVLVWSKTL